MKEIRDEVINIIRELFNIDEVVLKENQKEFLTGRVIRLNHFDMLILMLNLEKCFKIKFNKDDLLNYGLATVENITMTVSRKLD